MLITIIIYLSISLLFILFCIKTAKYDKRELPLNSQYNNNQISKIMAKTITIGTAVLTVTETTTVTSITLTDATGTETITTTDPATIALIESQAIEQ